MWSNKFTPGKSIAVIALDTGSTEEKVKILIVSSSYVCRVRYSLDSAQLGHIQGEWFPVNNKDIGKHRTDDLYLSVDDTRLINDQLRIKNDQKPETTGRGPADSAEVADKYVFKKNGSIWELVFEDKKLPPLKDLKGFQHIRFLLERPNQSIKASILYNEGAVDAETIGQPEEEREPPQPQVARSVRKGDGDLAKIRTRIKEIQEQIEETQDPDRREELREEEKKLINYAIKVKKQDGEVDKASKAVSKNIKKAQEEMKQHGGAALAEHLEKFIRTGSEFSYIGEKKFLCS